MLRKPSKYAFSELPVFEERVSKSTVHGLIEDIRSQHIIRLMRGGEGGLHALGQKIQAALLAAHTSEEISNKTTFAQLKEKNPKEYGYLVKNIHEAAKHYEIQL